MEHLRPLTESECYLRCYGWRGSEDTVRILPTQPVPRAAPWVTAERVRVALEAKIDSRDSEAA